MSASDAPAPTLYSPEREPWEGYPCLLPPLDIPVPERKAPRRIARALWFVGLVPAMSLMGLYSHMGADTSVSLGRLVTAEQLLRAGSVAVVLWLVVLALAGAAAALDSPRRRWLPQVVLLSALLLGSGVFLSMGLTVATARWDALWLQRLGSLGGFVALVCWLRSLSLSVRR